MKFASQLNDLNGGQYVCWHWFEYKFCELLNAKLSLNDAYSMTQELRWPREINALSSVGL